MAKRHSKSRARTYKGFLLLQTKEGYVSVRKIGQTDEYLTAESFQDVIRMLKKEKVIK